MLAGKQAHVTRMPRATVEGLQMFSSLTFGRGELLRVSGVSEHKLLRQRATEPEPCGRVPFLSTADFERLNAQTGRLHASRRTHARVKCKSAKCR